MPFIAVELDAMDKFADVGRSAKVDEAIICLGLTRMWRFCWREKVERITREHLRGFFGFGEIAEQLVAFGFLEDLSEGAFRVRGAERYLRVRAARSAGGKARAAARRKEAEATAELSSSSAQAQLNASTTPALTASSEQRTANSEQRVVGEPAAAYGTSVPPGPVVFEPPSAPPEAWSAQDFERWFQCRRRTAR